MSSVSQSPGDQVPAGGLGAGLVDRRKDPAVSGGLNVCPAEIEQALAATEGVLELAPPADSALPRST